MKGKYSPRTTAKIPKLFKSRRDRQIATASCPICNPMAEASSDDRGRTGTAASCVATISIRFREAHMPKPKRVKVSALIRPHLGPWRKPRI